MELSNEQRELLSAYLDGEVNASERALAQALLERNEAASYFESLKRVHDLAQKHGGARAPQNFAALVRQSLEGDFDGISRPTSNQGDYDGVSRPTSNQAPIHALPQATWRMPLLAAAAAIVMALSIFTYNALIVPTATPSEVAKLGTAGTSEQPRSGLELAEERGKTLDDHNEDAATEGGESLKKTDDLRRVHDGVAKTKKTGDAQDGVESKAEKPEDRYSRNSDEKAREGAQPGKDADDNSTPERSDKWHGESRGGGSGGSDGGKSDPEAKPGVNNRKRSEGKPTETPPAPPPAPDAPNPELKKPQAEPPTGSTPTQELSEEITINVSKERAADSPSLETDVLQVASVYGDATAREDESGTSIEIEVSEDQVEEMVAALNKLTKNPVSEKDATRPDANKGEGEEQAKAEPARARDYLPKELRGAVERDPSKDAKNSPENGAKEEVKELEKPKTASPALGAPPKKKVRVVVRLK